MIAPYSEPRPWRLKTHEMLPGEKIVTVVDRLGMPVWWPNLFHAYEVRDAGRAYATQKRTMAAVVIAFNWAAEKGVDIEARIASFEFLTYAETKNLQVRLRYDASGEAAGHRRTDRKRLLGRPMPIGPGLRPLARRRSHAAARETGRARCPGTSLRDGHG